MQRSSGGTSGYQRSSYQRRSFVRRSFRADPRYNRNHDIRAQEVRLIDDEGTNHGVVDIRKAMSLAKEKDMDLVEIAPKANPPVCKIITWSKFMYELKKKEKDARKNKQKDMKEFRFGSNIGIADKERLIRRAKEFLNKGHNVKVTIVRKRRAPVEQAKELLNDLLTHLSEYSTIDRNPSIERRFVSIILKGSAEKEDKKKKIEHAKDEDSKNSSEKVQKDKSPRGKGGKGAVQQKQTRPSSDKEESEKKKSDTK